MIQKIGEVEKIVPFTLDRSPSAWGMVVVTTTVNYSPSLHEKRINSVQIIYR